MRSLYNAYLPPHLPPYLPQVGVLDIRILNLDRHLGNILVTKDKHNGAFSLVPIDHGYCLPDFRQISDVQFQWLNFKQVVACVRIYVGLYRFHGY